MEFDLKTVAAFIRKAETEDLLDRVTVYRDGMEPAAVDLMENELWRRGITPDELANHARERQERLLITREGQPVRCQYCERPAASRRWGWYRIWGRLPVIPWPLALCVVHAPISTSTQPE
jgi:hypothetical protein